MAIETTNARYEGFIFDGLNSRDFGVYVQDVEVFGAPTRDVEMISIPGRNGEYAMDNGRFNNIQIKYVCALGADTQSDFNTAISDLRNWLASKKGYKRLEDEINTGEYRMAVFKDGLEVPTLNKKTGTFDVVFDCKPQRFLNSGETAVSVASGGAITNPTLFDAKPLLQVWGYGDISINGETISIDNTVIGEVTLVSSVSGGTTSFPTYQLNRGDNVTLNTPPLYEAYANVQFLTKFEQIVDSVSVSVDYGETHVRRVYAYGGDGTPFAYIILWLEPFEIDYLTTTRATENIRLCLSVNYTDGNGVQQADIEYYTVSLTYADAQFTLAANIETMTELVYSVSKNLRMGSITAYSTKSALGEPLYFDLDIGEAYKYEDTEIVSVNNAVSFPVSLPVLAPGANTIEYDNTVTQFKVVPRWWKV